MIEPATRFSSRKQAGAPGGRRVDFWDSEQLDTAAVIEEQRRLTSEREAAQERAIEAHRLWLVAHPEFREAADKAIAGRKRVRQAKQRAA